MLQQTRAETAIPYYQRFLERYPTVEALAAASEPDVLALWSGLGYYSRARNLLRAAREIVAAGAFPRDYAGLRALEGVGDYTAAAIASIAFGLPHAVVDGNVLRVVARMRNDAGDIAAPRTRLRFREIAQAWLDPRHPGLFNQALMELGAAVCLPRNPRSAVCPVAGLSLARAAGVATELPVKRPGNAPVQLEGALLVIRKGRRILLRQRDAAARRMAGFWDLPSPEDLPGAQLLERLGAFRHTITHHHYSFSVTAAALAGSRIPGAFGWFTPEQLGAIPLSTAARKGLKLAGVTMPPLLPRGAL